MNNRLAKPNSEKKHKFERITNYPTLFALRDTAISCLRAYERGLHLSRPESSVLAKARNAANAELPNHRFFHSFEMNDAI